MKSNAAPKYPFDMKALIDASGIGDLDAHLADRTYVMGGPEARAADAVALEAVTRLCGEDYKTRPHVNRWRKHLLSFDEAERKAMMVQNGTQANVDMAEL